MFHDDCKERKKKKTVHQDSNRSVKIVKGEIVSVRVCLADFDSTIFPKWTSFAVAKL